MIQIAAMVDLISGFLKIKTLATCDEWTFPSLSFERVNFHFRDIRSNIPLLKIKIANSKAPDWAPRLSGVFVSEKV